MIVFKVQVGEEDAYFESQEDAYQCYDIAVDIGFDDCRVWEQRWEKGELVEEDIIRINDGMFDYEGEDYE